MNLFTILTTFFVIKLGQTTILDEKLISGFLKEKLCSQGTILNCNPKQGNGNLYIEVIFAIKYIT